jgi:hypothetical protein
MSQEQPDMGLVGQTIAGLLGTVNEGFDWDVIERRYDEDPVGTAMALHFTDEDGEDAVLLGIADGPRIVMLDELTDEWEYIGAIVTYQRFGLRILDPIDDMTPDKARYQHRGVTIYPGEEESRERVWLVVSNVLDIMLETVIYKANQQAEEEPA